MIEKHRLPEIELGGETLGIADLHLDPYDEPRCAEFAEWSRQVQARRLLILGDLFDAWVGPAHESAPGSRLVIEALGNLGRRGVEVCVLQGNRDFLLGESFERASGARVCPEGLVGIMPDGERVLFLHGDELCTRDLSYQRLRRVTHSRFVQAIGPRVPLFLSRKIAARMRRVSRQAVADKLPEEKAIQEEAVRAYAQLHDCSTLVCGHAHEARDKDLGGGLRFLILDAYGDGPRDGLLQDSKGLIELGPRAARSAS